MARDLLHSATATTPENLVACRFQHDVIQYRRDRNEERHYMGKLKLLYGIDKSSALPGKIKVADPSIFL